MTEEENGREMPRRLPVFEEYTVDERLREFRKVDYAKPSIEFVSFDSPEGRKMLEKVRAREGRGKQDGPGRPDSHYW